MKVGDKINVHETWPVRHINMDCLITKRISPKTVLYMHVAGNGRFSGGRATKSKGRWRSA